MQSMYVYSSLDLVQFLYMYVVVVGLGFEHGLTDRTEVLID